MNEYSLIKMLNSYNYEWSKVYKDDHEKLTVVTKDVDMEDKI